MVKKVSRAKVRQKKHRRMRYRMSGTTQTPRLAVFRRYPRQLSRQR